MMTLIPTLKTREIGRTIGIRNGNEKTCLQGIGSDSHSRIKDKKRSPVLLVQEEDETYLSPYSCLETLFAPQKAPVMAPANKANSPTNTMATTPDLFFTY